MNDKTRKIKFDLNTSNLECIPPEELETKIFINVFPRSKEVFLEVTYVVTKFYICLLNLIFCGLDG